MGSMVDSNDGVIVEGSEVGAMVGSTEGSDMVGSNDGAIVEGSLVGAMVGSNDCMIVEGS